MKLAKIMYILSCVGHWSCWPALTHDLRFLTRFTFTSTRAASPPRSFRSRYRFIWVCDDLPRRQHQSLTLFVRTDCPKSDHMDGGQMVDLIHVSLVTSSVVAVIAITLKPSYLRSAQKCSL